ncbi:MAG TPA: glycosyltransferase [Rhizomicrobium sp.]|nr:glycosyltransferase [Rhizomicrobium sp.]
MSATSPAASVIIPHYNDLKGLDKCLAALDCQTLPRDQYEVIVADNASPQGEAAVHAVIAGRAKLVIVREKGAGPARNGGVALARAPILAFTDSDCRPEPGWLSAGLTALSYCDFAGGRMDVVVDDPRAITAAEAFELVFAFDNENYVRRKGFTVTANMFCPRAIFDRIGGFRAGLSEDVEWSRRATEAGFKLGYAPDAGVAHPARSTLTELKTKVRRVTREQFWMFMEKPAGRWIWLGRSCLLPLAILTYLPRIPASPKLATPAQRWGAVAVLGRFCVWRFLEAMRLLWVGAF